MKSWRSVGKRIKGKRKVTGRGWRSPYSLTSPLAAILRQTESETSHVVQLADLQVDNIIHDNKTSVFYKSGL